MAWSGEAKWFASVIDCLARLPDWLYCPVWPFLDMVWLFLSKRVWQPWCLVSALRWKTAMAEYVFIPKHMSFHGGSVTSERRLVMSGLYSECKTKNWNITLQVYFKHLNHLARLVYSCNTFYAWLRRILWEGTKQWCAGSGLWSPIRRDISIFLDSSDFYTPM